MSDKIIEAIFEGKGGSFNPITLMTPTTGFMVGGVSWTLLVTPENFETFMVENYVKAHLELLVNENFFVGWWTHKGQIYLDISERTNTLQEAVFLADSRKEKAIWHLDTSQEVLL